MEDFNVWEIVGALVLAVGGVAVGFFASQYKNWKAKALASEATWDDKVVEVVDKLAAEINKQNQKPE